jgi:hypothetical protein
MRTIVRFVPQEQITARPRSSRGIAGTPESTWTAFPPGGDAPAVRPTQDPTKIHNEAVSPSFVTRLLAVALVAFIGIASAILLWDGLAGISSDGGAAANAPWRARARMAVGVLGFAIALWIILGMLTHAH